MKKIALALIVLANLGNSSDDKLFVKKEENFNQSFIKIIRERIPQYIRDRNMTINEKEFKEFLVAESNKTEPSLERKCKFTLAELECPTLGKSIIGERVRNTTYIYQVKKEGCFKTQKVLNRKIQKLALKCLLKNINFNELNKTKEIKLNIETKSKK